MTEQDPFKTQHEQIPAQQADEFLPPPPAELVGDDEPWRPPVSQDAEFRENMGRNPDKEPTEEMKEYGQAVMAAMELRKEEVPTDPADRRDSDMPNTTAASTFGIRSMGDKEAVTQGQAQDEVISAEVIAKEQTRIKREFQNMFTALDGARDPSSLDRTTTQIVDRARKMHEGDMKLASFATAIGASEDPRFIGDVFMKLLDPELKSRFGDNYPKIHKLLSTMVRAHGDGMDPRYNGGDLRNKLQARSVLSGRVMQNVMSGNYTKVAELTEEQNKTLRSVMLGLATGVSVPEQRHRIAQELVKTIVQ